MHNRRLYAFVWKELLQISRDPSSILIAFVLPVLLLFIFGYGISLDSKELKIGVVCASQDSASNDFISALKGGRYFSVTESSSLDLLEDQMVEGRLHGILVLREDFSRKIAQGESPQIQLIANGSNPQIGKFVEQYVQGTLQRWVLLRQEKKQANVVPSVEIEPRFWYNNTTNSRYFLIPGSIAIILTIVGTLLTALVIAREWERGTMEALFASPISRIEILLGKVIPYYLLGIVSFTICLAFAVLVFGVPFRGSLWVAYLVTSLFLLGALGLGLTISAASKNQFLASQAAINAAFLPSFMLSGFIFEIKSMPHWIQMLTYVFPARYYVRSLQTLFLTGDIWSILIPQMVALSIIAVLFMAAINRKLKRSLD